MHSIATAALLSLAVVAASAAGTVNVTFVEPDKFYDAGNSKHDEPANLKTIEQHFKELGERYLADGQVLNISVLDIDLAGYMKPLAGQAREVRLTKGAADWPRIKVRYSLEANGAPVKSAEETLADLNYGRHGQTYVYTNRDPLRFEKQMIDSWFQARFRPAD
ncbi:MAG TPA: DUF3016 domain-containing protein [Burkholderiaceae bacterium]